MLKINKKVQRIMSFLTVLVLLFITAVPASAAVEYPQGINKQQAYDAIAKTDSVIHYIIKQTQNTTLRELAQPMIYSDDVLEKILIGVYKAVEENADALGVLGLDTSVSNVSKVLSGYGNVSQKLSAYPDWASITELGAEWGVTSKEDFAFAVSVMFSPFNDILYALLCSGTCSIGTGLFLNIRGSNGYETAIIPTLDALGCQSITSADVFYSHAEENKSYMLYHIAYDVLTFIEGILDAPCNRLTDILPSVAYFTNNGGLQTALSTLLSPLKIQLFGIATLASLETLISDSEEFTGNFAVNFNDILGTIGFDMQNVDFNLIASCGTVSGNKVIADKADVFIVVLRWMIDSAKLNESTLNQEVEGMNFMEMLDLSTALGGVMDKPTDEIISLLIGLMTQTASRYNDYYWNPAAFTATSVPYTANLNAEKLQRVVDGMDDLINQFIAESDPTATFDSLMQKEFYSSKTLSTIISELFGVFENEDMTQVLDVIGYDFSPAAIGQYLYSDGYSAAAVQLYQYTSWTQVDKESFKWGITDGNREQFITCLSSVLTPFEDMMKMLLCEGSVKLFGTIDIYGSNGYNTAIIPILEALGCSGASILTYEEFKTAAANGNIVRAILNPICDLIDQITKRPVYTLTGMIPNIIYFLDTGLLQSITNLMYPFEDIFETFDMENSLGLGYLEASQLSSMIGEGLSGLKLNITPEMNVTLPVLDLKAFGGMGSLVSVQSERVYQGQHQAVSYVQADRNAVMMALLRYVVEIIKTPGNESLINSIMSAGLSEDSTLASFAQNIKTELDAKTVDETVEWIYQLFFRERVTVEEGATEEYTPVIIYKEETDYKKIIATVVLIYVVLEVLYFFNRKKIREFYGNFKEAVIEKTKKKEQED